VGNSPLILELGVEKGTPWTGKKVSGKEFGLKQEQKKKERKGF